MFFYGQEQSVNSHKTARSNPVLNSTWIQLINVPTINNDSWYFHMSILQFG